MEKNDFTSSISAKISAGEAIKKISRMFISVDFVFGAMAVAIRIVSVYYGTNIRS